MLELIFYQSTLEPSDGFMGELGALIALGIVWLAVWAKICAFLVRCAEKLPTNDTSMRPWVTYMLLLPGLNLIFNFHVLIGLSNRYIRAFETCGRDLPTRESGRTEAVIFSAIMTVAWVPMDGTLLALLWMAGFASIIIYLFKIHSLSERFARIEQRGPE